MQQYQHILFMDIETVPAVEEHAQLSEVMQKEWARKARFLKSDTVEDAGPDELFSEKAGVYAEFAKVVCIGFGSFQLVEGKWSLRLKALTNDNEKTLLKDFADMVDRFTNYNSRLAFCGHNIKEFDVPFLCRRILINDIPLPKVMQLSGMKPWENPHIDTLELWKFGDYKHYTSLSLLAEILGIPSPKDDMDGSMVGGVYYNDHDLPRIAKYCLQDVVTSAKVYLRLKSEHADFDTVFVDE